MPDEIGEGVPCTGEISEKEDNSDPLVLMCMQTCRTMANRDTIPEAMS